MRKIAMAVHGGASNAYPFLKKNISEYEQGLKEAILIGYRVLKKGGRAIFAVEEAVKSLEDNALFNAGRGSALNCKGEVEMDASIMDGKMLKAGAVSMVRNVKNPITLARVVMVETSHVMLSGYSGLELAINKKLPLEKDAYFITENQYHEFLRASKRETRKDLIRKKVHGTVGAVALDKYGNLASATSTGGIANCMPGRIGDSCIIGAGCYANNKTCAISGTGHGEYLIEGVIAHTISMLVELKKMPIQKACEYVIRQRNKSAKGDIGVISIDKKGQFGIYYNSEIMKRAWMSSSEDLRIKIF